MIFCSDCSSESDLKLTLIISLLIVVGLKELTIFHCPLVTPEGLLSTLKLPFLRRLDYIAAVDVSNSFVLGIISQNPSLKTLAVNMMGLSSEVLKEIDDPQLTIDDMVLIISFYRLV